ncbi:MAG: glycoside hydrolase family 78 protein [Bryobacteraceae bacterium]|jgi:alpha-L-rhamnosidase
MKVLFCVVAFAAACAAASLQPGQLRVEYRANPQGIDVVRPRFSWILAPGNAHARGLHQTAYRILVSSTARALDAGQGDLWDSGKIVSGDSTQIVYAGHPLASGAAAFWRVRIWDQDGKQSGWSQAAGFTMGLLDAKNWQGKWIGWDETAGYEDPASVYHSLEGARWIWNAAGAANGAPAGTLVFHADLSIPEGRKIVRGFIIAGAANEAEVTVNSRQVATRSEEHLPIVADLGGALNAGVNAIEIAAHHGKDDTPAGLIAVVRVEFDSGEPLVAVSSGAWKVTAADVPAPQPAVELGPYGMAPWGRVGLTAEHRLPARYLRKEFSTHGKVTRATVYYSGLGLSELYLNGAKIGDNVLSPGLTDYDKHALYVAFDVTGQIANGANAIGLTLGNGRFYAPRVDQTRNFGFPKAILQLNLEYADGSRQTVVSDDSWKLSTKGPIRANNEYDGEEFDARAELGAWDRTGYDDSQWEAAHLVAGPSGALAAQMAEPLRVIETIKPVSVKPLAPGVWIYDMGQNMVGWCRLNVTGPRGARVRLRFAETLQPDGSIYTANLRTARAADLYTLRGGGAETWEPRFTYHGFRYVEVTGYPGQPTLASLEGRVVHDDMARTANFTSSSRILNQIHHNVFWGVRGNYRSIPTDCPQRDERQGWLGDRSQVSRSESYLFDVAAFYSKWERDLADSQRDNGSIPVVSPNYWPLYYDDLTWPSTFLFVPGMLYDQYGDRRVLESTYPAMKRWLDLEQTYVHDGLTSKDQYADWCVPPEDPKLIHSQDPTRVTDKTLIASAYYYHMLRTMSRYARILGKADDAAALEARAAETAAAFQRKFYNPDKGAYDNGTQTSGILPLYFQMTPNEFRAPVLASLARNIEAVSHGHVGTGLVGAQWLMRTLSDNGRSDLAYEIATQETYPGWGYMVEKGATTVWELWNGDTADPAMNSGNHVMQIGDLAVWMYEYLAGLRSDPDQPGFRHILIHPYPAGDLSFVNGAHQSPYGPITTAWKRDAGQFQLNVAIPPNTTATVWVPAADPGQVTESGHPAQRARGVKLLRSEAGAAVFEVESGSYNFRAPVK